MCPDDDVMDMTAARFRKVQEVAFPLSEKPLEN